jgi:O-antigen/teichoic acid export membrane protein
MAGLLNTIFERVQFLIIGKVFSPAALGYYTRAYSTQQLPVGLLSTIVSRVTFPVFSSISEDRDALYRGVRKALVSLAMLTFPLMLGICVAAKPLVVTIFGAKWLPCVSCLQVLCLAGLFWPLHIMNLNLLMAMGRSDLFFRLEVIKKVLITIALGVTFSISVIAMVWGGLAVSVACYFLNAYYPGRLIEYGAVKQLRDVAPCAAVSLGMGGCAWAVGRFFTAPPAALIAEVIVGVLVYWSLCAWLRLEIYMVVLDQAQRAIATKLSALLPPWTPGSRSRT